MRIPSIVGPLDVGTPAPVKLAEPAVGVKKDAHYRGACFCFARSSVQMGPARARPAPIPHPRLRKTGVAPGGLRSPEHAKQSQCAHVEHFPSPSTAPVTQSERLSPVLIASLSFSSVLFSSPSALIYFVTTTFPSLLFSSLLLSFLSHLLSNDS